ncbi:MFS transporter [Sphingomonas spermidinifaciens]|uniref:MFS transporter n=1 Tax=Sphingomonas spermidinifaciens TaxID=1141889 RepID=A0A2A4B1Q7_9SPHN|nr:peptide MFS transporter [Sphingomonas spermidinifaciens]PCD01895.1 MFS transporter [Sphingomonas spermidinifaciens]
MATGQAPAAPAAKEFLGHPRGLFVLFFAEMWERFSYYGMRAILILFLTKHFLFGDEPAYAIYGAYTSMVYITPVLGGYLADRYLGARQAVLVGGFFIAAGHLMIALFEGPAGQQGLYLDGFYLGLASIIIGTGFLKANISVLVGQLYRRDDPRRDPAFSIFYMGINLGGWLGPIAVGILGETVGWSWGFGAAGVGMVAGLIVFIIFGHELRGAGEPPNRALLKAPVAAGLSREWIIYLGAVVGVGISWWLIRFQNAVGWALMTCFVITYAFIVWKAVAKLAREDRDRIFAALFLITLCPLFWALFEQAGSSLNLYTDRQVDRTILGWEVPASVFQSVNSIFIIILAPIFAWLWTFLNKRGLEPSAPFKFGIGLIVVGLGFLVLVAGAASTPGELTPVIFIFAVYLLHTMAELCFSPVGLSNMTRLSVASMTGLMMGAWFLATAGGNFIASLIAQATGGEGAGPERVLEVYSTIGWFSAAVGVGVLAVAPFVARLMHLDTLGDADHALAGEAELAEPAAPGTRTGGELKV